MARPAKRSWRPLREVQGAGEQVTLSILLRGQTLEKKLKLNSGRRQPLHRARGGAGRRSALRQLPGARPLSVAQAPVTDRLASHQAKARQRAREVHESIPGKREFAA